jgi:thioredoxin-related protein
MKIQKIFSLLCVAFLGLAVSASAGDGWMTDFEAAKAKAKAENKSLLLDFTGSDWCGPCIVLKQEVFSQPAFKEYAAAELVLVELDFPRGKEQSAELQAQNEKLSTLYGVVGFPTLLVLSSEGELIGRTGFGLGGAEAYVEHIKEIVAE